MKSLKESIFDKKDTLDRDVYKYHPMTKEELRECIEAELYFQGPDANLNIIDTSKITDMSALFWHLNIRNIDISKWDVSNVENMNSMFYECCNFNCDISHWDVSNVNNMSYMFRGCKNFNSDLSGWNVSRVKNAKYMFYGCTSLKKTPRWYWYK